MLARYKLKALMKSSDKVYNSVGCCCGGFVLPFFLDLAIQLHPLSFERQEPSSCELGGFCFFENSRLMP
jgi:hypothetical protein